MNKNTWSLHGKSKSVSEEALHHSTEDEDSCQGMEPYLVRRLSSRNIQLPPLAFRQLEQADGDKKNDTETIPRPTTLPLIPPLIAITAAESSRLLQEYDCGVLYVISFQVRKEADSSKQVLAVLLKK
ncbi:cAMP-specific 3',5'-cyclic phosphodiesterase 4D-like [Cyanistes caeruleus]|uniref:cAMP-specific 3',5'-cyclic phosphodiesterase 4D-like n=1 Tax=Cyanistes caeruleus TaxID=156563 RepID=UPI000CDA848F|nr:cAMP-specific 3',5'-cyclic phosphodiesterase 4D-like [Cyanistes caeruleus]